MALQPALELWALVQALQDPGTAILTMGIRDLPYDLGYPFPLRQYRDGAPWGGWRTPASRSSTRTTSTATCATRPAPTSGSAICFAFGISHPCTAFDKWDVLYRVDEEFNVIGAVKTFF